MAKGTQLTFRIDTIVKINETSILLYAGANKIRVDKGVIGITLADNQGSMSEVCGRCSMMKVVTEEPDYVKSLIERAEDLGFEILIETERRRLKAKGCPAMTDNIPRICSSKVATFTYDLTKSQFVYDKNQCGHLCCLNDDNVDTTGELFCGYMDGDKCVNSYRKSG